MQLSQLEFIKCPECKNYSLLKESYFELFDREEEESEREILEWECPHCFTIISKEELKRNIIQELEEDFESKSNDFHLGQILKHMSGEIAPEKARELSMEYIKNLKTECPPSFEKIRVHDCREEWRVYFDKIPPKKGMRIFPPDYCVIVNKKTGEITLI